MKRNRNTFFSNYNVEQQAFIPNGMPQPYTQSSMNSSYYSGPDISSTNDIDNRLSKIERQINRLDNRLTKLENSLKPSSDVDVNNYNNMYML